MEFPRQEEWNGLPFSFPGDLPHPGIEPGSPALQVNSLPTESPGKPIYILILYSEIHTHTHTYTHIYTLLYSGSDGKEFTCNAGDPGSIPGWGRFPEEGNG